MIRNVLSFDFGASSGRAIIGSFDGEKITLNEVHRFSNDPVSVRGTLYWDVLRLFKEIKQGIINARNAGGFSSIGIDTWGVDFGLIDEHGYLLENPVHYRDARNTGMTKEAFKLIPRDKLYDLTGIQFMDFNTAFQLLSLKQNRPYLLQRAEKLLFMPDLFNYMLTGRQIAEYSIATTSQLVSIKDHGWCDEVFEELGIPRSIVADIVQPGTVIGKLSEEICRECQIDPVDVVAVCGHDTQSAITAVPCPEGNFAFISSGTWSLFGTELSEPQVNDKTLAYNFTNEGGCEGTIGFLKNICGLWLIQESRRQYAREGADYSYADLENLAREAKPFACFIDPDAPEFVAQGNMPERVKEFCRASGQYVPESVGEVIRCIYESLAMKYKHTFESIRDCTGKDFASVNVIGGGTKDTFLCGMTASACEKPVYAGPIEATVLGNIAVQLISSGDIKDVAEARRIIRNSEDTKKYEPVDTDEWNKAYEKFKAILRS